MGRLQESGWLTFAGVLAIVLGTLVAYAPAVTDGGFVWDDDSYVTENELLTADDGLQRIWLRPIDSPQYYPLVFTSFRLERALWDLDPRGYHAVNVALHIASALLLWLILARLGVPAAWLAAAVFALHPIHVESVAWITERKNTLSALFYLLALVAYLKFAVVGSWGGPRRRRFAWYAAALVLLACALLSKTVTCTLPVVILIVIWLKGERGLVAHLLALLPFFVLGAVAGLTTATLEVEHVGAMGSDWDLSFFERCLVAGRVIWFYVGKLLWPVSLAFVYPRWAPDAGALVQWLWPVAALAAAIALWALRGRLGRSPIAAYAIYVVTLAPALGFVNVFPMRYAFVADHFAYLASVPVIALAVGAVAAGLARGRAARPGTGARMLGAMSAGLAVLLLVALAAKTRQQSTWYSDAERLWRATIQAEPDAAMPHYNLAKSLLERGDPDAMEEAAFHFRETLRVKPDATDVHENLGLLLGLLGRYEEAVEQFELALAANPDDASAHGNLGTAYRFLGRHDESLRHYEAAMRADPYHDQHYLRFARGLREQGKIIEAIGVTRAGAQRIPDSAPLANSLAAYLCRTRQQALRDGHTAVFYAQRACALTGRRNPDYLHTLADALVEAGRADEAVTPALEALDIARALGNPTLVRRYEELLEQIESR
jgi:tetratricopeptide (TPR) repeat protein